MRSRYIQTTYSDVILLSTFGYYVLPDNGPCLAKHVISRCFSYIYIYIYIYIYSVFSVLFDICIYE